MNEQELTCEVCGKPICKNIYELTDELGVRIQMCDVCFTGVKEAHLLTPADSVKVKLIDKECNNESN